jgi:tetratricopeptide (TPR) repeat protein
VRPDPAAPGRLRVGPPEWVSDLLLNGHDGFSVSGDGRVVLVPLYSRGGRVIHRGPVRRTVRLGPQHDVRYGHISPDGRRLATCSHGLDDSGVRWKVWDTATGRLLANLPYPEVESVQGFSADGRWLYVSGKEDRRLEVASLTAPPGGPVAPPAAPGRAPWREGWRSERARLGGVFSPDNRLAAFGSDAGTVQLVLTRTDQEVAQLSSPEPGRFSPWGFSPDGTLLLAVGQGGGSLYVFDLRRIRAPLAELGLDWDAPAYPPAKPEETNPALAPRLRVELVGAEWAATAVQMAEYESRRAAADLSLNPFDAEAHYRLGTRLLDAGRPGPAAAHLTAALTLRPDLEEALYPRALAAFHQGRWAAAAAHATRCLEKCAFDSKVRLLRARARVAQQRYREAAADFSAVLAVYSRDPGLYAERARCYEALGKRELAEADRDRFRKAGGDNPARLNDRAWDLLTGPAGERDAARALELIRAAVRRPPVNPAFLNTLGVAQYRNGLYREAAATLTRSLAAGRGETDGFDLFALAMCHARLGDLARARDCFDRAVRWGETQAAGGKRTPELAADLREFQAEAEAVLKKVRPGRRRK